MNIFLNRIKEELKIQGITQKELAEKSQISVNTIRGWFSKDLVPDVFSAVKIAKALNTSVEYLVTGEKDNMSAAEIELMALKAKLADLLMFKN